MADAFDPSSTEAAPASGQPSAPPLESGTPAVDPLDVQRAEFARAEEEAQRLVKAKDPGAAAALANLERAGAPLGPPYPVRVLRLQAEHARAVGDAATAAAVAARWLIECGPDKVDRCRAEALGRIDGAVRKDAPERWKALATDTREADACTRSAEAAAGRKEERAPDCLPRALQFYQRRGDGLMGARGLFADGRIRLAGGNEARAFERLEEAARRCEQPRCREVRRKILKFLTAVYLGKAQVEAAARAALRDVDVHASSLPPASRVYAWTKEAGRACAAFDAKAGEGSCRRLERQLRGSYAFKDYSLETARGEGLAPDAVREVNAHFGVTLQECLTAEAARLRPPAQERYTVRWTVRNDGRVAEMLLDKHDTNDSQLALCLRSQMAVWRYPRFEGELQHVEQSFLVVAREVSASGSRR
jgi:hypothetical protein